VIHLTDASGRVVSRAARAPRQLIRYRQEDARRPKGGDDRRLDSLCQVEGLSGSVHGPETCKDYRPCGVVDRLRSRPGEKFDRSCRISDGVVEDRNGPEERILIDLLDAAWTGVLRFDLPVQREHARPFRLCVVEPGGDVSGICAPLGRIHERERR